MTTFSEAATGGVLSEKVFLEISKNTFFTEHLRATASNFLFQLSYSR